MAAVPPFRFSVGAVRSLSLHAVRSRSVTDVGYAHGPFSRSAGELYTCVAAVQSIRLTALRPFNVHAVHSSS